MATISSILRSTSCGISAVLALSLAPFAAGADPVVNGAADAPRVEADPEPRNPASELDYSSYTHHELTEVGARWDELGDAERRALLKEVKMRMARERGGDGAVQIRTHRRYGRIVRSSDGRVLRIETKVVQVRPVAPRGGESSFGVGFERRHQPSGGAGDSQSGESHTGEDGVGGAPALRVNDPR